MAASGREGVRMREGMRYARRAEGDGYLMSAALDIGTVSSCYAFCFRVSGAKLDILMNKNWGAQNFESYKTPTAVLTERGANGRFVSFGFDAEKGYQTLLEGGKATDKNLYHDFKMILYREKNIDIRRTQVTSTSGTKRPLLDVFVMTIQFLRQHMLDAIRQAKLVTSIPDDEQIRWVVTVPAIWSNQAKQFMRVAAKKAGLIKTEQSTQLLIVTEPSAAGLYCFLQEANHFEGGAAAYEKHNGLNFSQDMKYLVIDAGGGSVDFTAQQALPDDEIRELESTSGGDWGGREVNDNFISLLKKALGESFINRMIREGALQWYQFMAQFERAKTGVEEGQGINLQLPLTLALKYAAWENGSSIVDKINERSNASLGISENNGFLIVSPAATKQLFQPVMDKIGSHAKAMVRHDELEGLIFVFMVGGFSACKLLDSVVKKSVPGLTVLTPHEAQITIVKGAILYCNRPEILKLRSKKTYGAATYTKFEPNVHDLTRQVTKNGEDLCRDVFQPFIQKNEAIEYGIHGSMVAEPISKDASNVTVDFYCIDRALAPDEVLYVDSKGVRKIGTTNVSVTGTKREVVISVSFGHEILVTAGSQTGTAKKVDVIFDFESTT